MDENNLNISYKLLIDLISRIYNNCNFKFLFV